MGTLHGHPKVTLGFLCIKRFTLQNARDLQILHMFLLGLAQTQDVIKEDQNKLHEILLECLVHTASKSS